MYGGEKINFKYYIINKQKKTETETGVYYAHNHHFGYLKLH